MQQHEVTLEQRFHGSVNLVTLHLWRIAHSTDLDACFAQARELKMIGPEHEAFIRTCMDLDRRAQDGEADASEITGDLINELQACVLRLNSADPA